MKKRLLSLLLATLMIVAAIPASVLPSLAADTVAQGGEAGAEQSGEELDPTDDKWRIEQTEKYASLYADGAVVMLLAYDPVGGQVSLENGAGTWVNLVDEALVTIARSNAQTEGNRILGPGSYSWQNSATNFKNNVENNANYTKYTVGNITYAADGVTPLYATETVLYLDPGALKDTSNRKMTLNGIDYGIADMKYTSYKWVADASVTTYVKETKFYEKQDGNGARHMLSDTKQDGYTERVRHAFTTTPTEGYDKAIAGGYFEAAFIDSFGGWTADGKGISVELTDVMLQKNSYFRSGDAQIQIPAQYLPTDDKEYTLEIIAAPKQTTDTDGFGNTMGNEFNYQGEFARRVVNKIGHFEQLWGTYTTAGNKGIIRDQSYSMYNWGDDAPSSSGTKGRSDQQYVVDASAGAKIWTLTYERVKDGDAFDVIQRISYDGDNLADSVLLYDNAKPTVGAGTDFLVMKTVSNTTYSVRLYKKALSDAERAQNHFADLCAYFELNVDLILGATEEELAFLYNAFSTVTFESGDAKTLQAWIDSVEHAKLTEKYASLYAPGAKAILLSYNAIVDGTVELDGKGGGTWKNLVNDEKYTLVGKNDKTYTVDGKSYTTGWRLMDKGIGYNQSIQYATKNRYNNQTYLALPADLYTEANTFEVVMKSVGMQYDAADTTAVSSYNGMYELWGHILCTRNAALYFKHAENSTTLIRPYEQYFAYNATGVWSNDAKGGAVGFKERELSNGIFSLLLREGRTEDGYVDLRYGYYKTPYDLIKDNVINEKVSPIESTAENMRVLVNVPAEVYAVRVYNRVLTDEEVRQNHFVDLLAYHKIDIDIEEYEALPKEQKEYLHEKLGDVALDAPDAKLLTEYYCALSELEEIDVAAEVFSSVGVQAKIIRDGKAGENVLRTLYGIDLEKLSVLAEKYAIRVGAVVGVGAYKNGELLSLPELRVNESGKPMTENAASVIVWADSNDAGATFTFVDYDKAAGTAKFAYSVKMGDLGLSGDDLVYRYNTEILFRGFAIFENRETGEVITVYYDPSESFKDGTTFSYVTDRLLNYVDKEGGRPYAENQNFLSVYDNSFDTLDYYVDPLRGSDANDGQSALSPKKTVAGAYAAACERIDPTLPPSIDIHLAKGNNTISATESLSGAQLSAKNYRVRVLGDKDGSTLSSLYEISGSQFSDPDGDGIYTYTLPEGVHSDFRQLYVNGKMAEIAHTDWFMSKENEFPCTDEEGNTYFVIPVDPAILGDLITYDKDGKPVSKGLNEKFEWFSRLQWYYPGVRIVGIDWENPLFADRKDAVGLIVNRAEYDVAMPGSRLPNGGGNQLVKGYNYRVQNHLAFLDEAGEYYYDKETRTIYYKPEGTCAGLTFGIPMVEKLLSLTDIKNVSVKGVTFTGVDSTFMDKYSYKSGQAGTIKPTSENTKDFVPDAALYLENVRNITVDGCVFTETHSHGIFAEGEVRDLHVTDNDFTRIGSSAILVATTAYDSLVHNNYMKDIAAIYHNCCAITFLKAADLRILKNSIINCAYSGISVGWTWQWNHAEYGRDVNILRVETAYNYIENYMYYMYDGGAVYYNGGAAPQSYDVLCNSVHHNYSIVNSREGHKITDAASTGYYMDGGASHTYIHNNVVFADIPSRSVWSYISLQGWGNATAGELDYTDEQWAAHHGQQAYRITCDRNYFINIWETYKTTGSHRVRAVYNLFETNSYIFASWEAEKEAKGYTVIDELFNDEVKNIKSTIESFGEVDKQNEIAAIVNGAGCTASDSRYLARPDVPDLSGYRQMKVDNFENDNSANSGLYQSQENKYNKIP